MCVNLHLPSYGLYGNLLIEPMNHCHRLNRADFLFYNKASIVARKKKKKAVLTRYCFEEFECSRSNLRVFRQYFLIFLYCFASLCFSVQKLGQECAVSEWVKVRENTG